MIESRKELLASLLHQRLFEEREETDRVILLESSHHLVQLQLKHYVPAACSSRAAPSKLILPD